MVFLNRHVGAFVSLLFTSFATSGCQLDGQNPVVHVVKPLAAKPLAAKSTTGKTSTTTRKNPVGY
jgi:hypothetical protein